MVREVLKMWGIVVLAAACCLAFGAVDVSTRLCKEKRKSQSSSLDVIISEKSVLHTEDFDMQKGEDGITESR